MSWLFPSLGSTYQTSNGSTLRAYEGGPVVSGNTANKFNTWLDNQLTGNLDYSRQLAQNAYNAQEAQKQRDFEKYMSNTSFQRALADANAAGMGAGALFNHASGASTPSGAAAHSGLTVSKSGQGFANLMSSALGIVGSLITNGIRAESFAAANALSNQTKIDVAKLQGNNAVVIQKMRDSSYNKFKTPSSWYNEWKKEMKAASSRSYYGSNSSLDDLYAFFNNR